MKVEEMIWSVQNFIHVGAKTFERTAYDKMTSAICIRRIEEELKAQ